MTKTTLLSTLLLSSALVLTAACGKKDADSGAATASKPATATAAAPAEAKAAPAAAVSDIDLAKAGAGWQGFHVKGLAGAEVSDNGTGGVVINFTDNTMLQLTPADAQDMKSFKQALAANYKSVTYSTESPDEVVFTTVSDMGGNEIKGYGFSTVVSAGGKKIACGSAYDDEATAKRMLAVCKSLAKT